MNKQGYYDTDLPHTKAKGGPYKLICWISVEERLPEPDQEVISWPNWKTSGQVGTAYYEASWNTKWRCAEYMERFVTHWMLLPEPPREEE